MPLYGALERLGPGANRDGIAWQYRNEHALRLALGLNNGIAASSVPRRRGFTANDFTTFTLSSVHAEAVLFQGGLFDGRRVLYLPFGTTTSARSVILAYEVAQPFDTAASYTAFDLHTVHAKAECFLGAVLALDGYIYFVPFGTTASGTIAGNNMAFRFDTSREIDDVGAYEFFDLTTASGTNAPPTAGNAWAGAVCDTRYVYYCPVNNPATLTAHGQLLRYDTTLPFKSGAAWTVFDATAVNSNCKGMQSATWDGRYVYYLGFSPSAGVSIGRLLVYDTTGSFTAAGSYSTVDLEALLTPSASLAHVSNPSRAVGYTGAIMVGPYLLLVPWGPGQTTPRSMAVRYDTRLPLADAASYQTFDLRTINTTGSGECAGYQYGGFDGQYVHFTPCANILRAAALYKIPPYVRWDVRLPFEEAASWELVATPLSGSVPPSSVGLVYDGRYLYHVPYSSTNSVGVRVDVASPNLAGMVDPLPDLYRGPSKLGELVVIEDDFNTGGTATGNVGTIGLSVLTGAASHLAAEASHPGLVRFTVTGATGSGTATGVCFRPSGAVGTFHVNGASAFPFDLVWIVRINAPVNAPTYRIGLTNDVGVATPTDGIYFEKLTADSAVWRICCRAGSAQTRFNTGFTLANSTYYRLRIKWDGQYLKYSVNGSALYAFGGPNEASTPFTIPAPPTLPTAALSPFVGYIPSAAAVASDTIDLDYVKLMHSGYTR